MALGWDLFVIPNLNHFKTGMLLCLADFFFQSIPSFKCMLNSIHAKENCFFSMFLLAKTLAFNELVHLQITS